MIYITNEDQNEIKNCLSKVRTILNRYQEIDTNSSGTTTISRTKAALTNLDEWVNIINYDVNKF